MAKPNVKIVQTSPVTFTCGQTKTLEVIVTVFNTGEGEVCVELLADLDCNFTETSGKQSCKKFNANNIGVPISIFFDLTIMCDSSNIFFSRIFAKVRDSQGERNFTFRSLKVFCN